MRCVLYRESRFKFDEEQFANWLAEMQERYELVGRDSVSLPRMRQDERTVMAVEYVDTYKFVPRDPSKSATIQQASGQSVVVGKGPASGDRQ